MVYDIRYGKHRTVKNLFTEAMMAKGTYQSSHKDLVDRIGTHVGQDGAAAFQHGAGGGLAGGGHHDP